jgi:type I restriction enzyme S subunit
MSKWPTRQLWEVLLPTEQRDPTQRPNEEFSYVDIAGIDNLAKEIREKKIMIGGDAPSRARKVIRSGDVIVSTVRPNLNAVARVPSSLNNQICSTGFSVLRPSAELNAGYLFHFVRSPFFIEYLVNKTRGASYPAVSDMDIKSVRMPLPPLAEQDRIVRILDEAEVLRRIRAEADRKTSMIVTALFHDMFGDPARNPNHWPVVPVSKFVSKFQAGRSVAPAGEEDASSKYRIIKVSAVTWGRFAPQESKPVPSSYTPTPEQFVRSGDVLFSRANTTELVGATVLVEDTPDNLLLPDKIWRFVWENPDEVEPRFVLSLFQHPSVRRELGNRATGTGGSMKNISMDKVMTMEVPLPPVSLQRVFAGCVADIVALEATQAASRQRLDDLFQSLLHRAFQGEL